ncbi:DUF3298 domain-containing protein [Frederiksenia canicola]
MKKSLLAFVIASLFVVTACDNKTSSKLREAEQKMAQLDMENKKLHAELSKPRDFPALQVEIVELFSKKGEVKYPKQAYEIDSSKISVTATTAKTGVEWLDQLLLQKLYHDYLSAEEKKMVEGKAITQDEVITFLSQMYDKSEAAVKDPEDRVHGYESSVNTYYVGQRNHIVSFTQFFSSYSGGAHGVYHTNYLNIDINKKVIITLNDLVKMDKLAELEKILWNKYLALKTNEKGEMAELLTEKKDFFVPENFYFTANGMSFVYPIYTLTTYSEGEAELFVDFYDLKGLLNADYFPTKKDGFELNPTEF